jgi:hypothetical protein
MDPLLHCSMRRCTKHILGWVAKCKDPVFSLTTVVRTTKPILICVRHYNCGTCSRMIAEWRSARLGECE